MRFAVLEFPGSNCDHDAVHVLRDVLKQDVKEVWHQESRLPAGVDCVMVPGGFSYGDYLRCGAIARFSNIMPAVQAHAKRGGLVWGICNGFQVLTEAHLLPGALLRNASLKFLCQDVHLRVERTDSGFSRRGLLGQALRIPIAHGEGNYFAEPEDLKRIEGNGQVLFRYCDPAGNVTDLANPNGSMANIAGVLNEQGNVLGMMPHPERVSEPELGGTDGRILFESVLDTLSSR